MKPLKCKHTKTVSADVTKAGVVYTEKRCKDCDKLLKRSAKTETIE